MNKILITGANGFIGSKLCAYFLKKGWEVFGTVRETSDLFYLQGTDVRLIHADLRRPETIKIPRDIEFIIHSASVVSDTADDKACREGIYDLTRNLVAAARSSCSRLKRFVYVSTALTLGYDACDISTDNPGKSVRFLPYVRYKMETEAFLSDIYKMNRFPVVILRPGDVYGPNDRTSCLQMLEAIERGMPMIVGHGRWRFAYSYIDNFCQAAHLACESDGVDGRAFTVTNSLFPTWREWFSGLQEAMGKKQRLYLPVGLIRLVTLTLSGIRRIFPNFSPPLTHYRFKRITSHTTYNISETIQRLGYRPDDDLKAQIQATVAWYRQEKDGRSREAKG